MSLWNRLFGDANKMERRRLRGEARRYRALNQVTAASKSQGQNWPGITTSFGDDSLNRAYLSNLADTQSRAQDIDVNNPDIHGFHRTRTAQVLGAGVTFKLTPHSSEVGLDHDTLLKITQQVNRLRRLHSRAGGFDATGLRRSEGKQQERAFLTALVLGSCLVHRVWLTGQKLPLSLELIPGSRISTPHDKMGDPRVSYGVRYSDEHRSRVTGWYVRRVSKTVGNSFVPDYAWDFIPVEDGSMLSLTEIAGIDRALPLATSTIRMLRNRGEFLESAVESARAQATHYAVTQCAEGGDPYAVAADDADETDSDAAVPIGFTNLGGVQMLYTANGEKVDWAAAKLPEPDMEAFMGATDERLARGLVSSLSRFTRHVTSSWAGGRMEDQQDDPIIAQYRDAFVSAWEVVNEWFLDSIWLTDAVKLPGYNAQTNPVWSEWRAQFPGKLHINPVDEMKARELGYALRTTTPMRECESDGLDLRENLREWGQSIKMCREIEAEMELPEGSLDFILSKGLTQESVLQNVNEQAGKTDKDDEEDFLLEDRKKLALLLNRVKERNH